MKLVITGGSGLIGSYLGDYFRAKGMEVLSLKRPSSTSKGTAPLWDPVKRVFPHREVENCQVWIHLSGESIQGRWTRKKKERLWQSRVDTSRFLAQELLKLESPPQKVLSASAIGFYGTRRDEPVDESSPRGEGFLADLCLHWEEAWQPLREQGIPLLFLRFGVVLHPSGGALKAMLPPFRLGLGGPVGSGEQMMSWIHLGDVARAVEFLLEAPIEGPVNFTSPCPVSNREFSHTLARVLHRPAFLPAPAFVLKLIFGREMVEETLLSSLQVRPQRLLESGFSFCFPEVSSALEDLLS